MDFLLAAALLLLGIWFLNSNEQRRRIVALSSHFQPYRIEKMMESLIDGYLRCLGEPDAQRREQIWQVLDATEATLASQFQSFANDFAQVDERLARVSRLPVAIPLLGQVIPGLSFDVRQVFQVHARGIAEVAANREGRKARDKAYMMSAELLLMQHTCHWYCRSRSVASARMLARHKTTYGQLLGAVSAGTRAGYREAVGV
mgnify:FL=1